MRVESELEVAEFGKLTDKRLRSVGKKLLWNRAANSQSADHNWQSARWMTRRSQVNPERSASRVLESTC